MRDEPSQVLENLHPVQLVPVTCEYMVEGLLGTRGGRMLTPSLPSSLAQLCAMVTPI